MILNICHNGSKIEPRIHPKVFKGPNGSQRGAKKAKKAGGKTRPKRKKNMSKHGGRAGAMRVANLSPFKAYKTY